MTNDNDKKIIAGINSNVDKFLLYNKLKLDNLNSTISNPRIIEILESIPLFLNYNQPELPGFVDSEKMPTGIVDFSPSNKAMNQLRERNPSLTFPKKLEGEPFVQMFAVMGSPGTIAFTDKSDYDFWVCYDSKTYDTESVKLFKAKCTQIEDWLANKYNMEAHFFINEIGKVKNNIFDEDEKESLAGQSLGQLLKEEFFRSSIVLNGKIPFWWVVPSGSDNKTYSTLLNIINKSAISERFIDLGNVYDLNMKDFLLAALFQILKSLGNPFKSIIKLGLLDRYLNKQENPFICNLIKKNIHSDKLDVESVDAYLIMFNQIYDYYWDVGDDKSADIVKKSFYLKLDLKLSKFLSVKEDETLPHKVAKIMEYTSKWEWSQETIKEMDSFESWDIESVNNLMTNTKKYILGVYKNILSNIASKKIFQDLDQNRIKGITNRIYSHFAPAANKIDNTLSFKSFPPEKLIKIESVRDKNNKEIWILSKRVITKAHSTNLIIHKETSLIGIMVWISLNGVFQKDYTRLEISSGLYPVDPNFIKELIWDLSVYFKYKKLDLHTNYFFNNSIPLVGFIIINPFSKYSNDIDDIVFLFHNSWGETRYKIFKSEVEIPQIALSVLNAGIVGNMDYNTCVGITSSLPFRSSKDFLKIKTFLIDIYSFLVEEESDDSRKFVSIFGGNYFVFSKEKKISKTIINLKSFKTDMQMLYSISYNHGIKNKVMFDTSLSEFNYLNEIMKNFKEDKIQIYYEEGKRYCHFYISDERGSLITCRKNANSFSNYLLRLYFFAKNVAKQVIEFNPETTLNKDGPNVEVYKLERRGKLINQIDKIDNEVEYKLKVQEEKIVPFKLAIDLLENGELGYKIQLPDGGLSSTFNLEGVKGIANELKVLMESVPGYTFYVTDIKLSNIRLDIYRDYSSFSFSEKNKFEILIENSLK
ncbi:class I adenylate cyclase [Spirochaetota bacterium]